MSTDEHRANLAVSTDEYATLNSAILVRNSIGWSKDVKMAFTPLSRQNTFHFPVQLSYLSFVEERLLCLIIIMLSSERFVALGFCLILRKLAESACWLEGVVGSLQDVAEWFC